MSANQTSLPLKYWYRVEAKPGAFGLISLLVHRHQVLGYTAKSVKLRTIHRGTRLVLVHTNKTRWAEPSIPLAIEAFARSCRHQASALDKKASLLRLAAHLAEKGEVQDSWSKETTSA